jgi:hypothetical protein
MADPNDVPQRRPHTLVGLDLGSAAECELSSRLSEGSLDLLWRVKTPPHKRVCEYFPVTAFYLLSTHGGCLPFVAAGPFRVRHALLATQKDQVRQKPGLVRLGDLQTDQRLPLPGALRNLNTYRYSTWIEYTRRHSITVHEHKVALNGFCILAWNQALGRLP